MSAQAEPSLDVLAAQVSALDCENNEMPCAAYSLRQLADTVIRLRAENEALKARADESDRALRMFQAGLTDTLRVYNVPAMPSRPEAIHWLARNGARQGGPS